jgi:hypothetical protein
MAKTEENIMCFNKVRGPRGEGAACSFVFSSSSDRRDTDAIVFVNALRVVGCLWSAALQLLPGTHLLRPQWLGGCRGVALEQGAHALNLKRCMRAAEFFLSLLSFVSFPFDLHYRCGVLVDKSEKKKKKRGGKKESKPPRQQDGELCVGERLG